MPIIVMRLPAPRRPARIGAVLGIIAIAAMSVIAVRGSTPGTAGTLSAGTPPAPGVNAPSAPAPLRFRKVAPLDAVAINAELPVSTLPNPAARPFFFTASSTADRERAIVCLTSAIYYEAATEPLDGQRAVAQVVLNRVRHPAYPNSVCGVVYQGMESRTGCQFTFTCDGSLTRAPMVSYWNRARQVAQAALSGNVYKPVGWATHYHANWVVPYWSSSLVKAAVVGTHIFYRWTGGSGAGAAFRTRYAGVEPDVNKLRSMVSIGTAAVAGEEATTRVLSPEQSAALAAGEPVAPTGLISLQRAVLRRYGTVKAEGTTSVVVTQTRSDDDAIAVRKRWTLTSDVRGDDSPALGRKAEADAKPPPLEAGREVAAGGAFGGMTKAARGSRQIPVLAKHGAS